MCALVPTPPFCVPASEAFASRLAAGWAPGVSDALGSFVVWMGPCSSGAQALQLVWWGPSRDPKSPKSVCKSNLCRGAAL